jgi:hypothetical protein
MSFFTYLFSHLSCFSFISFSYLFSPICFHVSLFLFSHLVSHLVSHFISHLHVSFQIRFRILFNLFSSFHMSFTFLFTSSFHFLFHSSCHSSLLHLVSRFFSHLFHISFPTFSLVNLIQSLLFTSLSFSSQVLVIAAGGVYDGRGVAMALALGANGVWVGTRFVCAEEAGARKHHQKEIITADFSDTIRTLFYTG